MKFGQRCYPDSNSNESMTQENIGVWTFEIISSNGSSDNIAINLEEATRQEMLPLLQSIIFEQDPKRIRSSSILSHWRI